MDPSSDSKYAGPVRELITAIGAMIAALNWLPNSTIDVLAGVAIAGAMLVLGIMNNAGAEKIWTLVRKLISVVPGALLYFGVITPEISAQLTVMAVPLVSIAWSYFGKGKVPAPPVLSLAFALPFLAPPSCAVLDKLTIGNDADRIIRPLSKLALYEAGRDDPKMLEAADQVLAIIQAQAVDLDTVDEISQGAISKAVVDPVHVALLRDLVDPYLEKASNAFFADEKRQAYLTDLAIELREFIALVRQSQLSTGSK